MKTKKEIQSRIDKLTNGVKLQGDNCLGSLLNKIIINVLEWVLE